MHYDSGVLFRVEQSVLFCSLQFHLLCISIISAIYHKKETSLIKVESNITLCIKIFREQFDTVSI